MGAVIPFVARVRDSGDWSAAERAKLEALADRFADDGVTVEVVYGQTDDGDPWCVIKDDNEEVLLHVARIGGAFVVHYAADDSLAEAPDLPAALSRHLMAMDDPREGDVVVPFAAGRHAQILIALLAATAFFYETQDAHAGTAPAPPAAPEADDHAAVAVAALSVEAPRGERTAIVQGAAAPDEGDTPASQALASAEGPAWAATTEAAAAPPPEAPPSEAAQPPSEPGEVPTAPRAATMAADTTHEIRGSDAGERLAGTAGADLIRGEGGDDTLSGGGAPTGHLDTLDGGAGDDRIEVTADVVAIGGAGADTFVIHDPEHFGDAGMLLGFIADFHGFEGDRIIGHHGRPVTFVEPPAEFLARFRPPAPPAELTTAQTTTQVFVDLNGDGRPDGYLMLGTGRPADPEGRPQEPPKPPDGAGVEDLLPAGPPPGFSLFGAHDLG